MKRNKLRR